MMTFMDQMQGSIFLKKAPVRIISLVPSQTELLFDIGLDAEVIGITKFCVHPASWFKNKTRIGGTKNPDLKKIHSLQPDLILGNKEENRKEDIELLKQHFPVWMSDIKTLDDALSMIESIGLITGKLAESKNIANEIQNGFSNLEITKPTQNAIYMIWKNPFIAAGHHTFINDMMIRCGLNNIGAQFESRYPNLDENTLTSIHPSLVLLSSEPFPFREKHIQELQSVLPHSKILLVNGEMFSWYGSRLRHSVEYFRELMNNF